MTDDILAKNEEAARKEKQRIDDRIKAYEELMIKKHPLEALFGELDDQVVAMRAAAQAKKDDIDKKAFEKKSSALETLVEQRALEILAENGVELEAQEQEKTSAEQGSEFDVLANVVEQQAVELLIANGYEFGFRVAADQTVVVQSAAGNDIVAFNDATASSVAFQTGGAKVGGFFVIYSNPAGTAWIVENRSTGANTVTVA